jgi:hypothetical protein
MNDGKMALALMTLTTNVAVPVSGGEPTIIRIGLENLRQLTRAKWASSSVQTSHRLQARHQLKTSCRMYKWCCFTLNSWTVPNARTLRSFQKHARQNIWARNKSYKTFLPFISDFDEISIFLFFKFDQVTDDWSFLQIFDFSRVSVILRLFSSIILEHGIT